MKKDIFAESHYRGKHVVMIADKVFTAKTGKEASRIFDRVTKRYRSKIPTITYVPKEDALIL